MIHVRTIWQKVYQTENGKNGEKDETKTERHTNQDSDTELSRSRRSGYPSIQFGYLFRASLSKPLIIHR